MSDTNFQPIFDYIDEAKRDIILELDSRMDAKLDTKLGKIQNSIDAFAKESKTIDGKVIVQEHKTERLEHWAIKAADKVQVPYNP